MAHPWLRRSGVLLAAGLALTLLASVRAPAQAPDRLPPPKRVEPPEGKSAAPTPLPADYGGKLGPAIPVTLVDVLKLATIANLDVVQANLAIERARAVLLRARASFLPNFNIGGTYTTHDGQIQKTEGNIITVDRDSLFVGFGPSLTLAMSDALFGPTEARKLLDAARFGQQRITNETLLRVADAYFAVLRARRRLARAEESLDFLTSDKDSPLRGDTKGLLPLITDHVKAGSALLADQYRVEADVIRQSEERIRLLEEIRVAAAELARLLHLDPTVFLLPAEDYRWPLAVPGEPWLRQPIDALAGLALRSRPELFENGALVEAALARYKATKWRPFLPTLSTSFAFGGFGGGPAIVGKTSTGTAILGESGTIAGFGTRSDFDISLMWRLDNLGLGNRAQTRDARAVLEQTKVRQLQLQDRVVADVVQSLEQVYRSQQRLDVTRAGLFDAKGRATGAVYQSIELNFTRIKAAQGSPLEVLDSVRRLSDILDSYANALTDHDRARFRLLISLGMPPGALIDPQLMPLPDCSPPAPTPAKEDAPSPAPQPAADRLPIANVPSTVSPPTGPPTALPVSWLFSYDRPLTLTPPPSSVTRAPFRGWGP